jgi:hypothetical protein
MVWMADDSQRADPLRLALAAVEGLLAEATGGPDVDRTDGLERIHGALAARLDAGAMRAADARD